MSFFYILPALGLAITMIFFLGFYDFGMNSIPDEMYARPDMDISNLDGLDMKSVSTAPRIP